MLRDRMHGDRRIPTSSSAATRPSPVSIFIPPCSAPASSSSPTPSMRRRRWTVAAQLLYLDADGSDRDIALYLRGNTGAEATTEAHDHRLRRDPERGLRRGDRVPGPVTSTVAVLLAAGTPGKRMIAPSARVVLEEPTSPEHVARADDLAIQAAEIRRERDLMIRLLADPHRPRRRPARCRPAATARADRDRGDRLRARRPSRRHARPPVHDGGPAEVADDAEPMPALTGARLT